MVTQMTGINKVPFYLGIILDSCQADWGLLQNTLALGGLVACSTIEKFGRRILMVASTRLMAICQAAVAGLSSNLTTPAAGKAAAFFFCFFSLFALPVGMCIMPVLYAAEIEPLEVRHQVIAMAAEPRGCSISWWQKPTQWLFQT